MVSPGVRTSVILHGGVTRSPATPMAVLMSASLALRARKRVGIVRCPSLSTVIENSPWLMVLTKEVAGTALETPVLVAATVAAVPLRNWRRLASILRAAPRADNLSPDPLIARDAATINQLSVIELRRSPRRRAC